MFSVFQIKNLQKNFSLWLYSLFVFSFLSIPLHAETNASVSAGENHSLLLRTDGSLWSMGKNDRGQLGDGSELERGLVGWWKFDGDATDSSGNGNDGTVNGATLTTDRHGQANSAYSFDGVDDIIVIPGTADFDTQNPTISAWVFSINNPQQGFIFEKTSNGSVNSQYNLFFYGANGITWRTAANLTPTDTSYVPNITGWFFLTATYDGSLKKIFVNGSEKKTEAWNGQILTGASGVSSIGGYTDNLPQKSSYFFNGSIDDIRIYNRALSESDVLALHTLESFPPSYEPVKIVDENVTAIASGSETSYFIKKDGSLWGMGRNDRGQLGNAQGLDQGLVGWWKFDGDATDSSGNGNDGTVNGATLSTDRHGQASKAYSFDGVDDYISMTIGTYDEVTFSAWLKIASFDNEYPKLFDLGSSYPLFRIGFNGNRSDHVSAGIVGQMHSLRSSFSAHNSALSYGIQPIGSWINVVTSLGVNSFHSTFLDGIVIEQGSYKDSPSQDGSLKIGANNSLGSDHFFSGSVDDIRIYDRALSATEVSALYSLESQPEDPSAPIQIVDSNVTTVSSRGSHALFQKMDGSLWAMGSNAYGQLGDGTTTDRHTLIKIVDGNVTAFSAGGDHSRFVQADGSLWAMGRNHAGQLGDGTTTDRASPVKVLDGNVTSVTSGSSTGFALLGNGQLVTMGQNNFGQALDSSLANLVVPKTYFSESHSSLSSVSSVGSNAVVHADKLYHLDSENNQLRIFDSNTSSWSTGASPNLLLEGASAVSLNDKIYSVGGQVHGQIAWYKFDGDFNDSSGRGYNGTVDGAAFSADRNGDTNQALYFDGSNDRFFPSYGERPEAGFAFSFWAKPELTTAVGLEKTTSMDLYNSVNQTLIYSGNAGSSRGYGVSIGTNAINIINHGNSAYFASLVYTSDLSGWKHYVLLCKNNRAAIYIDGVFVRNGKQLSQTQKAGVSLGKGLSTNYYKGKIDSYRVFSQSLNTEEISLLYDFETTAARTLLQEYDPQTSTWFDKPSHSFFLHGSVAVALNGALFQVGGIDENGIRSNRVFHFDGTTEAWTEKASMSTARSEHALLVHNAKIWAVGGTGTDGNATTSVEVYDPQTDSWTSASSLRSPYERVFAWKQGNDLYAGGWDETNPNHLPVDVLDEFSGSWSSSLTLPTDWNHSTALSSDDSIYFLNTSEMGEMQANAFSFIDSAGESSYFIDGQGIAQVVGANDFGQLGDGTTSSRNNPVPLDLNATFFSSGGDHTLFIKQDGTFWGMGRNDSGQIGDGSLTNRSYPVPIISSYTLVVNGAAEGNATGGGEWSIGTPVTLTATPHPGYLFAGWTGDLNSTDANITISPSANMEINATFAQDLNDNDDDNLTNFYEIVTLGTNADNNDTDGDGLPDGVEDGVLGIDPLLDNAPIVALFAQREIDAHAVGLAEGNASGQQYVYDFRSTFSLYNEAEVNASAQQRESNGSLTGEPLGRLYVQANPTEFNLYTEADLNASMDSERVRGIADGNLSGTSQVVANPSAYGLYSETEVNASLLSEYNRGVSEGNASGWSYLQSNRLAYSLFNSSDLNTSGNLAYARGVDEGNTSGIAYAVTHPSEFSLHTSADLNESGVLFRANGVQDGNASGQSHVLNNLSSFQLFTESELNATRLVELELGRAEGNQSGMSYVLANPHEFNLFESIDLNRSGEAEYLRGQTDGDLLGRSYVQANPNLYQLFTQSDLNATATLSHQSGRGEGNASGITYLQTHARDYGLYTRTDRELLIAQARSEGLAEGNASGIAQVQASPANYSLLSLSEAEQVRQSTRQLALSDGFQIGVDWVKE